MAQAFTNQSTSDDDAKVVLANDKIRGARNLYISNTGANPALFCVDADGVTWRWLAASSNRTLNDVNIGAVQIKNEGAGNDLTNIDGDVW